MTSGRLSSFNSSTGTLCIIYLELEINFFKKLTADLGKAGFVFLAEVTLHGHSNYVAWVHLKLMSAQFSCRRSVILDKKLASNFRSSRFFYWRVWRLQHWIPCERVAKMFDCLIIPFSNFTNIWTSNLLIRIS